MSSSAASVEAKNPAKMPNIGASFPRPRPFLPGELWSSVVELRLGSELQAAPHHYSAKLYVEAAAGLMLVNRGFLSHVHLAAVKHARASIEAERNVFAAWDEHWDECEDNIGGMECYLCLLVGSDVWQGYTKTEAVRKVLGVTRKFTKADAKQMRDLSRAYRQWRRYHRLTSDIRDPDVRERITDAVRYGRRVKSEGNLTDLVKKETNTEKSYQEAKSTIQKMGRNVTRMCEMWF